MNTKIDVLDHGFVRLVSYTQPVTLASEGSDPRTRQSWSLDRGWTGDLEIVRNARVSFDADWRGDPAEAELGGKDERLVHYLWSHRHTSPFEALAFTFEVKAPIFVLRQWHRHRTWSYNEVSARYAELPDDFYVPALGQVCAQSSSSKQGREAEPLPVAVAEGMRQSIADTSRAAHIEYQLLLRSGLARELARLVLPVNTYSRMFATVDLRNLFHFLELRLDAHAQYEIRVYAEALLALVEPLCPVAVAAFKESQR